MDGHDDEEQNSVPPGDATEGEAPQAMNAETDSEIAPRVSEDEPPRASSDATVQQDSAAEQDEDLEEPAALVSADFALDIFATEQDDDEDEQDLPEGLVDIDAETLLSDCQGVLGRLTGARPQLAHTPGHEGL